ncbi:ArsR/SmtB family transcription factor [Neisseria sp.]|uniref:ArsR/SmtB family transcription factor n=1 Tax=Neisseria sp. TaxID=192066 RepID=UPI00359F63DE
MEKTSLSAILKTISHPERMEISLLLLHSDRSISELADETDLSASTVSKHLTKMRNEGIVDFTRYHRVLEYRLVSSEATAMLNTIETLRNAPTQVA